MRFVSDSELAGLTPAENSDTASPVPTRMVSNGEFTLSREDGVAIAGRQVSGGYAIGTINLAPCTHSNWSASSVSFH